MPEHPTRPDRPGPLARRRAALAAAGLAVAGLVLLSFALVARDSSGQVPGSAVVPPGGPTTVPVPTIGTSVSTRRTTRAGVDQPRETARRAASASPAWPSTVSVGTARELQRALDRAVRGQRIRLADGVYQGEFVLRRSGTASKRIALCGSRKAVLRGDTLKEGYVLHLDGADHWTLSGFSVTNGEKGIMADRASRQHHPGHRRPPHRARGHPPARLQHRQPRPGQPGPRHRPAQGQVRRGRLRRQRPQQLVRAQRLQARPQRPQQDPRQHGSAPTSPPRGSTSRRGPAPGWSAATTSSGGT